jgi:nitroreductase
MGHHTQEAAMDVIEAIKTKRAIREFTDQAISDEDARTILNAGRRAQSSKNTQPWTFVAIRDRETLRRLSECGTYAGHLAGAALGVALVSVVEDNFDIGQAAACMQLAAWELGIGSCIASMWEPERAKEIIGVPTELHFHTAISFGYPRGTARPAGVASGRRPLDEVVRWERYS